MSHGIERRGAPASRTTPPKGYHRSRDVGPISWQAVSPSQEPDHGEGVPRSSLTHRSWAAAAAGAQIFLSPTGIFVLQNACVLCGLIIPAARTQFTPFAPPPNCCCCFCSSWWWVGFSEAEQRRKQSEESFQIATTMPQFY